MARRVTLADLVAHLDGQAAREDEVPGAARDRLRVPDDAEREDPEVPAPPDREGKDRRGGASTRLRWRRRCRSRGGSPWSRGRAAASAAPSPWRSAPRVRRWHAARAPRSRSRRPRRRSADMAAGARGFRLDVTRRNEIDTVVADIGVELGPIDILVNNAGITLDKRSVEVTDEEWDEVLATNLTSMFRLARAVAPGHDGAAPRARSSISARCTARSASALRRLLREQGRCRSAHAEPRRRVGAPRHPGQLPRSRLRQHGHPARGHGRREAPDALSVQGTRPAGSASRRRSPRSPSIWPRRPRTS